MPETTLIIHGWSDCSASFKALKQYLVDKKIGDVSSVFYGDYESREDNITFNDVADGLNDELVRQKIIDPSGKKLQDVNVIVHSTGGLVIRHWLSTYYPTQAKLADCPVRRIVMLAPANFGSPLAHRGKSLLGSLVKGRWKVGDLLEVGRQILSGLELGSSYQWGLAHRDLLSGTTYYAGDHIQTTVLVGADDYTGMRGWVNKPGTDGTVVVAGTALNSVKLKLDFAGQGNVEWESRQAPSDQAFGVLAGFDHGSIVRAASDDTSVVSKLLVQALSTKSKAEFNQLKKACAELSEATYAGAKYDKYQQFLARVVDDQGEPVRDYTLEFYLRDVSRIVTREVATDVRMTSIERKWSERVQQEIMGETHTFEADSSHRRLLVCERLVLAHMQDAATEMGSPVALCLRIHVPKVDDRIKYRTNNLVQLVLARTDQQVSPSLFFANTTTLVEMRVNRFTDYVTLDLNPRRH